MHVACPLAMLSLRDARIQPHPKRGILLGKRGGTPQEVTMPTSEFSLISQSKRKAFYEEFPWLESLIRNYGFGWKTKYPIRSITVQRIDKNLLARVPRTTSFLSWTGLRILTIREQILAVETIRDGEGCIPYKIDWWNTPIESSTWINNANVIMTIMPVVFFHDRRWGYHKAENLSQEIVIYKSPKNFTIREWIIHCDEEEKKLLKRELKDIDAAV
jgi:hypothetical protein